MNKLKKFFSSSADECSLSRYYKSEYQWYYADIHPYCWWKGARYQVPTDRPYEGR